MPNLNLTFAAVSLIACAACTGRVVMSTGGIPTPSVTAGGAGNSVPQGGASGTQAPGAGTGSAGGTVAGSGGTAGTATGTGGTTTVVLDCSTPSAPRTPTRRLTRFEYNKSVRDIFKITTNPADALPGEEAGNEFGNDADSLTASRLLIDGYRSIAHDIALKVAPDNATAAPLAGCVASSLNEATCSSKLIADLGARIFRRPLEERETTSITAIYNMGRMTGDFAAGARAVIERMLQSPQFLYRLEFGEKVDVNLPLLRPTPYEMASRLSYLFWGSAPDMTLLDVAKAGKLRTKADVQTQAERLIADDRAKDVVRFFHGQLYGIRGLDALGRVADVYPTFKPGMGSLFRQETEQFIDNVIWKGSGTFNELFTAPYTFVNGPLAAFYGITGVTGVTFTKVTVDPAKRMGMLTHASILALTTPGSRTDPVVRGKWIYQKILCGYVPDPPPGIPPVAEPTPGVTTRQRFEEHRDNDACRGCHVKLDPIGYAFEHYDGVGLWRDTENGLAIDASGRIPDTDAAGDFDGAIGLARKLGGSLDAQKCFVGKWLTYAYGRLETKQDACTRRSLEDAFATTGGDIRRLMVALTQTDAFLYGPTATGQN